MPTEMVALKEPRREYHDDRFEKFVYHQSAPFFQNPRGVLIHRVRSLWKLTFKESRAWWIVDYWCENGGRSEDIDDNLLFDPGERLVCARCEANAVARGEKTSTELAGRHVCTGVCRPVNTCCTHEEN